jgi:ATP-binding cassette subfamily F protein uup
MLTASQFLQHFLFTPEKQHNYVYKLSGGEKRRLYLCTVLMSNPNFLVLDEPTNDLDILTLNVLEEYLQSYTGSVIIVSHDRFFLDKIADHLFIFEGDGQVKDFVGSYSGYREYMKDKEKERKAMERVKQQKEEKKRFVESENVPAKKRKLSYKEQRELEQIEKDLETLNAEKVELEEKLSGGNISGDELTRCSTRIGEVIALLDEKEMRWLELNDN